MLIAALLFFILAGCLQIRSKLVENPATDPIPPAVSTEADATADPTGEKGD